MLDFSYLIGYNRCMMYVALFLGFLWGVIVIPLHIPFPSSWVISLLGGAVIGIVCALVEDVIEE